MTINLKQLVSGLRNAEAVELPAEEYPVSPYLVESLANPLLAGREMKLGDLDYSAFDFDDLDELSEYLNICGKIHYRLSGINQVFCQTVPLAEVRRAFC